MTELVNDFATVGLRGCAITIDFTPHGPAYSYTVNSNTYTPPGIYYASYGSELTFTATATFKDPNASAVEYIWDLGDDTIAYGQSVEHKYLAPNPHLEVILTVIDNTGNKYFARKLVPLTSYSEVVVSPIIANQELISAQGLQYELAPSTNINTRQYVGVRNIPATAASSEAVIAHKSQSFTKAVSDIATSSDSVSYVKVAGGLLNSGFETSDTLPVIDFGATYSTTEFHNGARSLANNFSNNDQAHFTFTSQSSGIVYARIYFKPPSGTPSGPIFGLWDNGGGDFSSYTGIYASMLSTHAIRLYKDVAGTSASLATSSALGSPYSWNYVELGYNFSNNTTAMKLNGSFIDNFSHTFVINNLSNLYIGKTPNGSGGAGGLIYVDDVVVTTGGFPGA